MPRLPQPGGDAGSWGEILNEYLAVEHDIDGSLKHVARPTAVYLDEFNPDGREDWTTPLNDALASGALVLAGSRDYPIGGRVIVGPGKGLLGMGAGKNAPPTRFVCTTANAGISFGTVGSGGQGPKSGNFTIDGSGIATLPLFLGRRVQTAFDPLTVLNSAGVGVLIQEAQNVVFTNLTVDGCAGSGVVFDLGCGGLLFNILEVNNCGAKGGYSVEFVQSGPQNALVYAVPTDILITQAILERPATGAVGVINFAAGADVTFDNAVTTGPGMAHVKMSYDGSHMATRLRMKDSYFYGDATSTIFDVADGCMLALSGVNVVNTARYLFKLGSGAVVQDDGYLNTTNVATQLDPSSTGTTDSVIRDRRDFGIQVSRDATGNTVLLGTIKGETGGRFRILADGSVQQGNGNDFNYAVARLDGSGSWKAMNLAVGAGVGPSFGGGNFGIVALGAATAPTSNPANAVYGFLFVDSADNKLKFRGRNGTITEIANP